MKIKLTSILVLCGRVLQQNKTEKFKFTTPRMFLLKKPNQGFVDFNIPRIPKIKSDIHLTDELNLLLAYLGQITMNYNVYKVYISFILTVYYTLPVNEQRLQRMGQQQQDLFCTSHTGERWLPASVMGEEVNLCFVAIKPGTQKL